MHGEVVIERNVARTYNGGGIASYAPTFIFEDQVKDSVIHIRENRANKNGGGISFWFQNPLQEYCCVSTFGNVLNIHVYIHNNFAGTFRVAIVDALVLMSSCDVVFLSLPLLSSCHLPTHPKQRWSRSFVAHPASGNDGLFTVFLSAIR
jgi:hypothetical protein